MYLLLTQIRNRSDSAAFRCSVSLLVAQRSKLLQRWDLGTEKTVTALLLSCVASRTPAQQLIRSRFKATYYALVAPVMLRLAPLYSASTSCQCQSHHHAFPMYQVLVRPIGLSLVRSEFRPNRSLWLNKELLIALQHLVTSFSLAIVNS